MTELRPMPASLLADLLETVSQDELISEQRRSARTTVALSSSFAPGSLTELDAPELSRFLIEDCEQVRGADIGLWRLRSGVRQTTLGELERAGRLDEPAPLSSPDPAGESALRYITGTAEPLEQQKVDDLAASLVAVGWLSETSVARPPSLAIRGRLEQERLLEPLRILVADGFFGRESELAAIRRQLDLPGPTSLRPYVIVGAGGVGKSTLIAQVLLSEVEAGEGRGRLTAYLSFDRPELNAAEPLTLLRDALLQVAAQRPELASNVSALVSTTQQVIAQGRRRYATERSSRSASSSLLGRARKDEAVLIGRFVDLLRLTTSRESPVWVLDTFEVAQRQSEESLDRLWDFLDQLSQRCDGLHVLIAGRAPAALVEQEKLDLGELDRRAAGEFIRSQLADLHLSPSFLAAVLDAVRPYPLTLRLTVLRIRGIGADLLRTRGQQEALLAQLRTEPVQGVLYRRILDHIEDPDVAALAKNGLLIRRITPAVIHGFLAERCGLGPVDRQRADTMFSALRREVGLVQPDGYGGLVQRPEFRRLYLDLVERVDAERNRDLRRAAVDFYTRPETADQVEELYYRLALGQPTSILDAVFDRSAGERLAGVADEFPASSQVYLAGRLGYSVDADLRAAADDLSWARQVASSARRLLDAGRAGEAYDLLQQRSSDVVVPIVAPLRVEAAAVADGTAAGLAEADRWLGWATAHADDQLQLGITRLAARLAEDAGEFDRALQLLDQADRQAASTGDTMARLNAQVSALRVHRRAGAGATEVAIGLRATVIDEATALGDRLRAQPALLRELAAEIGDDLPELYDQSLALSGYDTPEDAGPSGAESPADPLTSSEYADRLREDLSKDAVGEVHESVAEGLRYESDEAAF